jgi:arylsulfatase A-like enzyme
VAAPVTRGLLALLLLAACDDRPVPAGPDVVLLTIDTLRADRLGFVGHPGARTPHLDALAARGRVFTQATTPLPRTSPALASLLTGRTPEGHGSVEVGVPIDPDVPTLAQALHAAGWETVAVSGSPVAGPEVGLGAGFSAFEVLPDPPAMALTERALSLVGDADTDRPVLLWVHYVDPHFPYAVSERAAWRPTTPDCAALARKVQRKRLKRWRIFGDTDGIASGALADCSVAYDAEVAHVDEAVGALLAGLGPRAEGLVLVTSDHGENMGENGLWYEHGPDLHDASLRVPLVLAGPGVAPGRDAGVARLEDVPGTLLRRLGMPPLAGDIGADLLGPVGARPDAAVSRSGSALHARLAHGVRSGRAGERSCVHGPTHSLCGDAVYDRAADPALKRPLAAPPEDLRAALAAAAGRWPAEATFQHAVRTPYRKLVATPRLEGGYAERWQDVPASGFAGQTLLAIPPAEDEAAGMRARLPAAVQAGVVPERADREQAEALEAALGALGYIEQ